jgi:sec-independent protein translocase protein TatA
MDTLLFVGGFGPMELFVIFALLVLLFGAQKLPELGRAGGQALGEFQKGRTEVENEIRAAASTGTETALDEDEEGERLAS